MKITPYGYDNFGFIFVSGLLIAAIGYILDFSIVSPLLYALGGLLCVFALWFFRDPNRTIPAEALQNDEVIIAPADGKVVQIKHIEHEPRVINGPAVQLSIFLSPVDVHVNRAPTNGSILFSEYKEGDYLMAFHEKSSEENEQTVVGLENSHGKMIFKQITGFLARRIVCDLRAGDTVKAGDQFGMMKFGSRMDLIVPSSTQILVAEGDRTVGGEQIIARFVR